MAQLHLGIDVSKSKLDCALRLQGGKYRSKVIPNSPEGFAALLLWLEGQQASQAHACMEATGVYWEAVAHFLTENGIAASVVNPAQVKAYGASRLSRTKTDKADARLIADFCLERNPSPWQAPGEAELALRALVLRLESLQAMRTQESNRLGTAREPVRGNIQAHLDWLDTEIKALAKAIKGHIDSHPGLKKQRDLLDSIPGLGERTIAILLAYYAQRAQVPTRPVSPMAVRPPPSPGLTPNTMSQAAVSTASPGCPRSAMPSCARHSICPPWSRFTRPIGANGSKTASPHQANHPNLSSAP